MKQNCVCAILFTIFLAPLFSFSQQPKLMLPTGHMFQVANAFFSDDDKYIITRSENVKIWEAATGKLIKNYDHNQRPEGAEFINNNETVIITYPDSIRFWNIKTDKLIQTIAGNNISIYEKENFYLLMNASDNNPTQNKNARLYDLKKNTLLHEFDMPLVSYSETGKSFLGVNIGKVKVYDSAYKTIYSREDGNIAGLSKDYKYLAILQDTAIDIVNPYKNEQLQQFATDMISSYSVRFIPDSNTMLIKVTPMKIEGGYTLQAENTYFMSLDLQTFKVVNRYAEQKGDIKGFDRTNQLVAASSTDSSIRVWNIYSGKLIADIKDANGYSNSISFSNDKKYLIATSNSTAAQIWDIEKQKLKFELEDNTSYLKSLRFSENGKFAIFQRSNDLWLWDLEKGKPAFSLPGEKTKNVNDYYLDSKNKKLYTSQEDKGVTTMGDAGSFSFNWYEDLNKKLNVYNIAEGKREKSFALPISFRQFAISPDGQHAVIASKDSTAYIMNLSTGTTTNTFKNLTASIWDMQYINDGKELITISDKIFTIYNSSTLEILSSSKLDGVIIAYAYSPISGFAVFVTNTQKIIVRDIRNNKLIGEIKDFEEKSQNYGYTDSYTPVIDQTGRFFCIKSLVRDTILIIEPTSARLLKIINTGNYANSLFFNRQNNLIVTSDGTLQEWNLINQKQIATVTYETDKVDAVRPDNKYLIGHNNTEIKIIDVVSKKTKHHLNLLSNSNYIVTDDQNRYDGTEDARKMLYFMCGTEVIELDQVKDQLWVPGLAERIMKGETINAKTLAELNLCGFTPEVNNQNNKPGEYNFKIIPRRGGLGETVLFVNGIEAKKYQPQQLQKKGTSYELIVKKDELSSYFISGSENIVTVKAYTSKNDISSRGLIVKEDKTKLPASAPDLYAVIVGISDYKGEELDLKFAAKDATDISSAIAGASRKLLNADGKEHVFMYNLTTAASRYLLPEKNSIRKTLSEIGKKAKANDILIIFFAGHGVMEDKSDKKQFYFLTADASTMSAANAIADVGISTAELSDWIKPANVKAQKRILIFDACNSGQAIRDFVQLGKPQDGYVAARNDEKARQTKAIEKLNNESGLFILSASASNQSAYEIGRYSQGLLTYSLLKVIKQQPEILENGKYLDVSNWFNAAKKMVTMLAGESGARQEPQLNANNNFSIGVVDEDVRSKIVLSVENPLFTRSNFQNTDTKIDNLKLRTAIDKELTGIGTRTGAPFMYSAEYDGEDAYTLTGDYKITGDDVNVTVLLVKGGVEKKQQFELKGNVSDINSLALKVTAAVINWLSSIK